MTNTKSSYKKRYILFILTVVITIVANESILRHNLNLQDSDAKTINIAGRQRMLSQRIAKNLLFLASKSYDTENRYSLNKLGNLVDEFEDAHEFLHTTVIKSHVDSGIVNSYKRTEPHILQIISSCRVAISNKDSLSIDTAIKAISGVELSFLVDMENMVGLYQKAAEKKLSKTKRLTLILSIVSILILIGEFIFIIIPFLQELFKKNHKLEVANRRLSDFAHITSHNLRAPISNLNSLLHFMQESESEEETNLLVSKFQIVLKNLNETMNNLIEALKTQATASNSIENLVFENVLEKTTQTLSGQILESKAIIKSDFSQVPSIAYNPLYLESIFQNLITNSIKYKFPERIPEIFIRAKRKNGKTELSFTDNGLGINMKRNADKVFGLNKVFHKHPDAKGVGLFMTRTQVESLEGTITVESEENKGSTFTIIF